MRGRQGDADTRADVDRLAHVLVRFLDGTEDTLGESRRLRRRRDAHLHDGELVTAEAADKIRLAHAGAQTRADAAQKGVSGGVPEVIVDVFEVVDVYPVHG